jgi:2-keto-3-deoxy-L-rhamnonate aldolase RhmA
VEPREWEFVNDQIMVTVIPLESKKGIDSIEEIISVRGLDMVSLSVSDLSFALGYPGQPMHAEVVNVRDKVWELCKRKGIVAYALGSQDLIQYYYRKGVRVFMSRVNLRKAFQDHVNELRRILS